jgi:hypothetical protein
MGRGPTLGGQGLPIAWRVQALRAAIAFAIGVAAVAAVSHRCTASPSAVHALTSRTSRASARSR